MMLHTKYQSSMSCVSDKKIFSCFPYISLCKTCGRGESIFRLCDLDMQWTGTIRTIYKECHIRIIPAKFGQNPASS